MNKKKARTGYTQPALAYTIQLYKRPMFNLPLELPLILRLNQPIGTVFTTIHNIHNFSFCIIEHKEVMTY